MRTQLDSSLVAGGNAVKSAEVVLKVSVRGEELEVASILLDEAVVALFEVRESVRCFLAAKTVNFLT